MSAPEYHTVTGPPPDDRITIGSSRLVSSNTEPIAEPSQALVSQLSAGFQGWTRTPSLALGEHKQKQTDCMDRELSALRLENEALASSNLNISGRLRALKRKVRSIEELLETLSTEPLD